MGLGFSLSGQKSSSSTSPWGPQQGYLKNVWSNAKTLFNQYNPQAQQFGGEMANYGRQLMPALGSAFNYWQDALNGDPELLASIMRDQYRAFTENELPGISTNAIGLGTYGGSRQAIQEAIAARGFADRAADMSASLRHDAANSLTNLGGMGADMGMAGLGFPMDLLSRYANIVQAGSWGGKTEGTTYGFEGSAKLG